jgi:hypothetical protein
VPSAEVDARRRAGWRLRLRHDDFLEMVQLQAWYFQVRFFPRLAWLIVDAPPEAAFVTSDRLLHADLTA